MMPISSLTCFAHWIVPEASLVDLPSTTLSFRAFARMGLATRTRTANSSASGRLETSGASADILRGTVTLEPVASVVLGSTSMNIGSGCVERGWLALARISLRMASRMASTAINPPVLPTPALQCSNTGLFAKACFATPVFGSTSLKGVDCV